MANFITTEMSLFESILVWIFVAAIVIYMIFLAIRTLCRKGKNKMIHTQAVLVSKTAVKYVNQPVFMQDKQVNAGLTESGMIYKAIFSVNEKNLEFEISPKMYNALTEGQEEELVYKGISLIQFGHLRNDAVAVGSGFIGLDE